MSLKLYAIGAAALVIVGMSAAIYKYRGDAIAAQAEAARVTVERDRVLAISAQKDREIERLVRLADINNSVLAEVRQELQDLNAKAAENNQQLAELENTNAEVRLFLDTALPADLKRLLNVR